MENNAHASNSQNLKLNSISSANDCQKAKLVELMANYFMKGRGHLKESDALEFAEDAYNALLSAGALVQADDHFPRIRKMVPETLLDELAGTLELARSELDSIHSKWGDKEHARKHSQALVLSDAALAAYEAATKTEGGV